MRALNDEIVAGLIAENERTVAELRAEIAELEGAGVQPPKPDIKILSISALAVSNELRALGQKLMYPVLLDASGDYYYTNDEGWAQVFDYIYAVFDMPLYIAYRMDCEDFGVLLKGLVSALFGLNYFALTIGNIPQGCHGFDFFKTDKGMMIIEPQTAQFFEWKERGYEPKYALL